MSNEAKAIFEFAPFRLDAGEALLTSHGAPVPLPPKVFDLLVYLTANAGRLVEKDELLKALWPDSFVEEANLTVNIAALRRNLGSQPDGQPWIETVPKRGYRFIGKVERIAAAPPPVAPALAPTPQPVPIRERRMWPLALAAILVLLAVGGYFFFRRAPRRRPTDRQQVLAVLPFQDLSTGSDDQHAGLGMTDALITRLGSVPELMVRALGTVRKYDGANGDPLQEGKELGADTVLTGSVQRIDKRIRVSVRLLRVQDGQSLWAEKFDEFFTNVFAVQDAISEKLSRALELRLTSEEQDRMMRRYTENTEAYRLFESGRYSRFESISRAVAYFKQAVEEVPRYVLPYVDLANIYISLAGNGLDTFQTYAPLAQNAVEKAMQLGPDLADSRVAQANFERFVKRDFASAARDAAIALRLNPRSARAHSAHGLLLTIQGDAVSGVDEGRAALRLDPFNAEIARDLAWMLYCARQYETALATISDMEQRDPRFRDLWNRFYCLQKLGRFHEAIDLMEDATKPSISKNPGWAAIAHAYAASGREKEARQLLHRIPENWGHYQRAAVDAALGDRDAALDHLNRAVDERSVWIEWLKADPSLDPVRGDPRFAQVVKRMGLTP
jgi:DNA-binding winged helix-turn-helix (wHTH) protein/TolB-like protein/Tfp pilus assembly protein PilF